MKEDFIEMLEKDRTRKSAGFDYLLTYEQVARILKLKENTLRVWVSARKIPFVKLGSAVRFTPEMVENMIKEGTKEVLV